MNPLPNPPTFDQVWDHLPYKGWLARDEAELLWAEVNAAPTGRVLEVGCYHGRSTCLLAASGRELICVDPFSGFDTDDPSGAVAREAWHRSVVERGYADRVSLYEMSVEEFAPWKAFREPPWQVAFAYLDGDHTYEGTKAQVRKALEMGALVVAMHDVNDQGGGAEVKRAALRTLGSWHVRVNSLAVWRRE